MTRHVKIERLRIRVPADKAAAPKRLALEVARHLAEQAPDWGGTRVDTVRAQVRATGSAGGLARDIAMAVRKSAPQRGER